jgi:hypothetical protein
MSIIVVVIKSKAGSLGFSLSFQDFGSRTFSHQYIIHVGGIGF